MPRSYLSPWPGPARGEWFGNGGGKSAGGVAAQDFAVGEVICGVVYDHDFRRIRREGDRGALKVRNGK